MKASIFRAAPFAVLAGLAAAVPASAQEVRIRDAVARVAVIPEDRTDIAVEIEPGAAGLPAIQVTRRGSDIRIDGDLGRNAIRNCSAPSDAARPGDGAMAEVRGHGRIEIAQAPLIVVRTPRSVSVSADGAVFGSVGRGASSVELANGGCGAWDVANTDGALAVALGGSGQVRAGTSRRLDVKLGGSGRVLAGSTGDLKVAVGGSGNVAVASVAGPADIAIGGSGDVRVQGGSASRLKVAIGGSGDVTFEGVVVDVDVAIAGSGDVRVAEVTGRTSRSVVGSGQLIVGR